MSNSSKIATCGYCGTQTVIVLDKSDRHQLTCTACSAPLSDLQWLKPEKTTESAPERRSSVPSVAAAGLAALAALDVVDDDDFRPSKKKKKKKKKEKRKKSSFERIFDAVDDIFD